MINNLNIQREMTHLMCDELIGRGQYRQVYSSIVLPDYAIKLEYANATFCNAMEWKFWCAVMDTPMAKWFAPCKWISGTGQVLLMQRTRPLAIYPKSIPSFFEDIKKENWGEFEGRPVCHDYANMSIIEKGLVASNKKVIW